MKKAAVQLCVLLRSFLFIGFSIQILLGLAWLCTNFMEVQAFAPAGGLLYPLLLQMFGGIPQFLYILQLGAAFAVGYVLIKPYGRQSKFWKIWYVLAFMTFPMALQCHLALLPHSFVSSLILLELMFCRGIFAGEGGVSVARFARAAACWLGLALLLPEYVWLGIIPPVLTLLLHLRKLCKQIRQLVYCVLLIAAFGGMIAGLRSLASLEGKEGGQNTFWFSMASRTAWPRLLEDHPRWSEELRAIVENVVWDTSRSPDNMERIFKPVLEQAVGEDQAQEYYREIAKIGWQMNKRQIVNQIAGDLLAYAAPSSVLQLQLSGRSYAFISGRNYEIMCMNHPRLTKYYVSYSCWWFFTAMGATVLLILSSCMAGERLISLSKFKFWAVVVIWSGVLVCFYTMQGAGIADYKYTIAVASLWSLLALVAMGRREFITV
ncbi:MAG: hypothetical protein J1E03_01810 [Acetatifactor sp.]|nr:hypothetical protein [Acetatifactor sp.]